MSKIIQNYPKKRDLAPLSCLDCCVQVRNRQPIDMKLTLYRESDWRLNLQSLI